MEIQIKLINQEMNLHIFQNYSLDAIKLMLQHNPDKLLQEIIKLEEEVSPKRTWVSKDNDEYVPFFPPAV